MKTDWDWLNDGCDDWAMVINIVPHFLQVSYTHSQEYSRVDQAYLSLCGLTTMLKRLQFERNGPLMDGQIVIGSNFDGWFIIHSLCSFYWMALLPGYPVQGWDQLTFYIAIYFVGCWVIDGKQRDCFLYQMALVFYGQSLQMDCFDIHSEQKFYSSCILGWTNNLWVSIPSGHCGQTNPN